MKDQNEAIRMNFGKYEMPNDLKRQRIILQRFRE